MELEKIGSVTLDYRFYPGEDRYSDGAVEDEMLRLAQTSDGEQLEEAVAESSSWPILYHFSHIRENILSWFPFDGTEHVLEVGSGLGAVTGVLSEKAAQVTCIDLSRRRSLTNAWRHRGRENIRIIVGNFQDIAGHLDEKYDLITLIGVFEYAQYSISSDQPFLDYLKLLKGLLAPGGRLVIAIENRLGLKYWAGAAEDHTGIYFDGLEGYTDTDYVRTFSRPELENLLNDAGYTVYAVRYPYPDYKLPDRIYTDGRLPGKGEISGSPMNFDRERMLTFREGAVADSLVRDGLYPVFANSFFVEAGLQAAAVEKNSPEILFSRFSVERDPHFRVRTDLIRYPDGKKAIRKYPAHPLSEAWTESLPAKEEMLKKQLSSFGWEVNRAHEGQGYTELEWVSGRSLDEVLDGLLEKGQKEECIGKLCGFLAQLDNKEKPFRADREFEKVFGRDLSGENTRLCAAVCSDLDLIASNVILGDHSRTVIDYEWTFPFSVPAGYLQYRVIHYYVHGSSFREACLTEEELFERIGMKEEDADIYHGMEKRFQQYILGNYRPIWTLYPEISPGTVPVLPLVEKESERRKKRTVEVFFDDGSGFTTEKCRHYHPQNEEQTALAIRIPEGTRRIRIDPSNRRCVVRVLSLKQGGKKLPLETNGRKNGNGDYVFDTEDPQMIVEVSGTEEVRIRFIEEEMKGLVRDAVLAQSPVIHRMTQTRLWKAVKEQLKK